MSLTDYCRRSAGVITSLALICSTMAPYQVPQQPQPIEPIITEPVMATHPPTEPEEKVEVTAEIVPTPAPTQVVTRHIPLTSAQSTNASGDKYDWMRAAGIPEAVWPSVDYVITKESGWNPGAVNRSSGACGLGQQLPCGKWPHQWNDPVGGLIDATSYAVRRYGGWPQAEQAWRRMGWW